MVRTRQDNEVTTIKVERRDTSSLVEPDVRSTRSWSSFGLPWILVNAIRTAVVITEFHIQVIGYGLNAFGPKVRRRPCHVASIGLLSSELTNRTPFAFVCRQQFLSG